jgi:F-type H+-transporting ATPase subunit b
LLAATPDGRVFGLDQQTLISVGIQLLNACFLAAVLSYVLYRPVRDFMRRRTERINAQVGRAQEDVAKAGELKAQYEKKLKDIEHERIEILESAHRLAAEKGVQLLNKAKKEAAALKERAMEEIRQERESAGMEIRLQIIEVASMMAEKFVVHALDTDTQDRLFEETMAELENATWRD